MLVNFIAFGLLFWSFTGIASSCPQIINRYQWGAISPYQTSDPATSDPVTSSPIRPASHVIVHHTRTPTCLWTKDCKKVVKALQTINVKLSGREDIAYNFLIGEDGNVYEGVGWQRTADNIPSYDSRSIHIALMGDYTSWLPNEKALNATKRLIKCGVSNGFIEKDYSLFGHEEIQREEECPGKRLLKEIRTWSH